MPEIIGFSNELCYTDTPLIPLRQYPPSRLPPIQVRFVKDGYREGKSQDVVNRPEAAAVAKTVIDCLNDPRYKDKSFGVICLQGHAQAQLIESMILERIGPKPFKDEKTRLLCGDPYSFQGDERDIVFLSMVASVEGEAHSAPLTQETFKQRFNVAASRPRDQVWLFHSIRESDLHPECMRRKLLNYYYNPPQSVSDADLAKCESGFERDVATRLIERGFRVIPQFPVAGYRIDLVIEDRERRLAIECDGDTWHGPGQYEADMARQRMLERCGWKFIRIRGSVFYANPSKAIEELIRGIRDHGLAPCPITDDQAVPRDWVQEISGNECMEALGAYTVDRADENIVEQRDLLPEESARAKADGAPAAVPKTTAAEDGCRAKQSTPRMNPAGVDRFLKWLKPYVAANKAPPTPLTAGNCPTPKSSAQPTIPATTPAEASPPNKPMSMPAPTGNGPPPPTPPKPTASVVSEQERRAVFKALDEATRPLIMWQLAEKSKIAERRMEEILPVLVREGLVKRVESPDAVRYSRNCAGSDCHDVPEHKPR